MILFILLSLFLFSFFEVFFNPKVRAKYVFFYLGIISFFLFFQLFDFQECKGVDCLQNVSTFMNLDLNPVNRSEHNKNYFFTRQNNKSFITELIPNTSTLFLGTNVTINGQGARDFREYQYVKREGVFRILVLGDSFTFGWGVNLSDSFPKILEKRLKEKGYDVEVLTFAMAGWNTLREVNFFLEEGYKYEPDLVLIGYFINDAECDSYICPDNAIKRRDDVLIKNNNLFFDSLENVNFFNFLYSKSIRVSQFFVEKTFSKSYTFDLYDSKYPNFDVVKDSFKLFKDNARNVGILVIPWHEKIEEGEYPFTFIHLLVEKEAKKNGFFVIDVLPNFIGLNQEEFIIPNDGHASPLGHEIYAELIFKKVEQLI